MILSIKLLSDMTEEFARKILDKVRVDYDAIAESFSATRTRPWPEMERMRGRIRPGDRLIDIGCGNGRAYPMLSGLAVDYVGLDGSERLVRLARERYSDLLAEWRVGTMLDLPFGEGEFDAALAFAVLHHIPSRAFQLKALREACRVLRPGGQLLMTNWNLAQPRYIRLRWRALVARLMGSGYDAGDVLVPWRRGSGRVDRYCHAFSRREIAALCREAGFEVEENAYVKSGLFGWLTSGNLVTVCRKPEDKTRPAAVSGLD